VKPYRLLFLAAALISMATAIGADGPFQFYSVVPCRIIDTRTTGGPMVVGETRGFQIAPSCTVPSGAKMAALNFTAIAPSAAGHITAYPAGTSLPLASTLNFSGGESALCNGSVVSLTPGTGTNTGISVTGAGAQFNLIIDVTGYLQ
jgi:hypothetical protein